MKWTYEGRENAATAQKLREGHTCKVVGFGQSIIGRNNIFGLVKEKL